MSHRLRRLLLAALTVAIAGVTLIGRGPVGSGPSPSAPSSAGTSTADGGSIPPPPTIGEVRLAPPTDPAGPQPPGPRVYGDDEHLDGLFDRCRDGSGAACDRLFEESPAGSDYERFGVSCGERPRVLHCTSELDGPTG